jgi:N-acetyl-alpha-D-glucosaminyl L-malate synthase BshA
LAKKGHEIHFITYRRPPRLSGFQENIFFHEVNPYDYPLFEYVPYESTLASKLVHAVISEKLDLLHVHYAIPHAAVAYLSQQILKKCGVEIPIITTLHGTDITLVGHDPSFSPVVQFSINESDGVTAVSEFLKKDTESLFKIENEIEVITNFVDFERFRKTDKAHFKKAIAPKGEKILTHTSNFRKVKRVDDVVRVFDRVLKEIPAKLLLIGDGPERQHVEQLCQDLGIVENVVFLGKQDAIEEILAVSDVFLLPSESESFGLAALEAMACEVPVISTNTGGLTEVNIDGITGFVSDVGDVDHMVKNCLHLLNNEEMHNAFRKQALKQARRFDLHNILPYYESYYQLVLSRKREALKPSYS